MDLKKINNHLSFYFKWSNAKEDPEAFLELDKQMDEVTKDFFIELTTRQKFFSWMRYHFYFEDSKEYISTMAAVGESLIKSAKNTLICFDDEKKFESYIFKSMKGKANMRILEGNSASDILEERTRKAQNNERKKMITDEEALDGLVDKVINSEILDIETESNEETYLDYDEDGNEILNEYVSIENFADASDLEKQEMNILRTDISLLDNTIAYLLVLIYRDLSEDDIALDRKIAWQIGADYEKLRCEKVGLTDRFLVTHDCGPIVRYEHFQNIK